jgi:hypothetical protein
MSDEKELEKLAPNQADLALREKQPEKRRKQPNR